MNEAWKTGMAGKVRVQDEQDREGLQTPAFKKVLNTARASSHANGGILPAILRGKKGWQTFEIGNSLLLSGEEE